MPVMIEYENPYVCLIGGQKSGTTSLYRYLSAHPAVHPIRWKESKLFLHDPPLWDDERRFRRLSEGCGREEWLFETSTYYTKHPRYTGVPARMAAAFPDARLIYLVRNPVERVWSQYCHYLAKDWEREPFAEAIRANPDYLNFSRYYLQIQQYLQVFPADRLLVVIFEEFIRDKLGWLRRIYDFLGIEEFCPANIDERYNDGASKRAMTPALRLFRSLPGYRRAPWGVRKWATRSLGGPLPNKEAIFTRDLQRQILDALKDDLEAFQTFLQREIPDWPSPALASGSSTPSEIPTS